MVSMESCVPPGFRFHPTDEELVGYYLKKKVASQKIDLDVIRDIDLYRIEPWDLQERCRIGYEEQSEWYFFSHKDKKYPTGTRTNRATMAGFWKATGRDKAVQDKSKLIGMRKTLVFYKGRAPNGQKTDWIMHEYRLETEENAPPPEEGWVVCRAFKKRTTSLPRTTVIIPDAWDSTTYCFDDHHRLNGRNSTSMATMVDPSAVHFLHHQQQHHPTNLFCKEETELQALALLHSSNQQFAQLPPLESPPTLPLIKQQPTVMSSISMLCENEDRVTDWRALDKFVASQLSQEDGFGEGNEAKRCLAGLDNGGGGGGGSDMAAAMLLLEEGSTNFGGLLSSEGTCIFEK